MATRVKQGLPIVAVALGILLLTGGAGKADILDVRQGIGYGFFDDEGRLTTTIHVGYGETVALPNGITASVSNEVDAEGFAIVTYTDADGRVLDPENDFRPFGSDPGDDPLADHGTGTWCQAGGGKPYKYTENGTKYIEGGGRVNCWGHIVQVKVGAVLQKHSWGPVWNNLASSNSGWVNGKSVTEWVSAACLNGTYTYRTVADGVGKSNTGGLYPDSHASQYFRTTCP